MKKLLMILLLAAGSLRAMDTEDILEGLAENIVQVQGEGIEGRKVWDNIRQKVRRIEKKCVYKNPFNQGAALACINSKIELQQTRAMKKKQASLAADGFLCYGAQIWDNISKFSNNYLDKVNKNLLNIFRISIVDRHPLSSRIDFKLKKYF